MRRLVLASFVFSVSACFVAGDGFGVHNCHVDTDCPAVAGYTCVSGLKWPQAPCSAGEEACICEVRFPPEPGGIALDGGGPMVPDAGPPPEYCTEIKPIILQNCVQTCHGEQMQVQNAPTDFRLDYWEPYTRKSPDGGPGLPGIQAKLDRIKARMYDDWLTRMNPMPPDTHPIQPTAEQRRLVNKWITTFGAPLGDGGCEILDGGRTMTDAGTNDGGSGSDAGPPVSFSAQILPIFRGGCNCHTGGNTSGTLNLSDAAAYASLVNANVSANCAAASAVTKRVLANNPAGSQLWLKLKGDPAMCLNSMPRGLAPLAQLDGGAFLLIERWIRQGAPNN